ncbi:MAG: hypothetical protein KC560_05385 [Myxococcales bacterium]|nr:hypothetical protein [Myxococcales bacterium]
MSTWHAFYAGDLQSLWALLVAPFAFLAYRGVRACAPSPRSVASDGGADVARARAARFLSVYTVAWAVETMLDPIVGGPIVRALGWSDGFGATAVMFAFVLLGDLRVLVLVLGLGASMRGEPASAWGPRAFGLVLVVPIATGAIWGAARALDPSLPGQGMWLVYELGFVALASVLARREVPRAAGGDARLADFLRSCLGYVAAYYALWAACDVVVLAGVDEGWALRIAPNQLYYALWIPFVHARSRPLRSSYASSAAHAS